MVSPNSPEERLALAEAFATLSGSERGNALCSLPLGRHYRLFFFYVFDPFGHLLDIF